MRIIRLAPLTIVTMLLSAGALAAAPVAQTSTAKKTTTSTTASTHVTKGVVKTVDPSSLVIARGSGKNEKDMTFALDASTQRPSDLGIGSQVEVHYKTAGKTMTAVSVQPVKQQAAAHKASNPKPAAHKTTN
jgi:hypothetical protein